MKVTLEPTAKITELIPYAGAPAVPARIWEGTTGSGIPVHAYITRIAVDLQADSSELEAELKEQRAPSAEIQAIPARLIL